MKSKAKQTLSLELTEDESARFDVIIKRAKRRNPLCIKSHVIRELLGLTNYSIVSERDKAFFRGIVAARRLAYEATVPHLDAGEIDHSEAPRKRMSAALKRDKTMMQNDALKHSAKKDAQKRKKKAS